MKTLVTQLKEAATGAHLFKVNDFVVEIESDKEDYVTINMTLSSVIKLNVSGMGYITSNNYDSNADFGDSVDVYQGNTSTFIKILPGTTFIKISDKKNIKNLGFFNGEGIPYDAIVFTNPNDNSKIKFNSITLTGTNINDILLLSKYYEINDLLSFGKFISLAGIKRLKGENILKGNISYLCEGIIPEVGTQIELSNQNMLYGDLSKLRGKLGKWYFKNCGFAINLDFFNSITNNDIGINDSKGRVTGSILNLPNNINFVSFSGSDNAMFLSDNLGIRTNLIGIDFAKFSNCDKFLNNLATLAKPADFNSLPAWSKVIRLIGSRTNASDSAVNNLVTKGYSVIIIPNNA